MDFDEIMRQVRGHSEAPDYQELNSKKEAMETLDEYFSQEINYKVGDYVERNELGKKKYKHPSGNQVAKVVAIVPHEEIGSSILKDTDGYAGENVVIAVAVAKGTVITYNVDGRLYQKAKDESNISFLNFRKGK